MPPAQIVVTGVFDDDVRAEQAVAALKVWAGANRKLRVGSMAVVARKPSGATIYRQKRVIRPRHGAWVGLLAGLVLLALPAAGAAALAAWVIGSIVLGLLGLVGVVPGDVTGTMAVEVAVAAAVLAAVLAGALGALVGCLVGAIVGLIDTGARGVDHSDLARTLASLSAGSAAAVVRTATPESPLVEAELVRLGGTIPVGTGSAVWMVPVRTGDEGTYATASETPSATAVQER